MVTIRILIRWFFSLAAMVLLFAFILRLFMPASAETAPLVHLVRPVYPFLESLALLLASPAAMLCHWLVPVLPAPLLRWFPVAPAAPAVQWLGELFFRLPGLAGSPMEKQWQALDLPMMLPGAMDWRYLLAMPLWGLVECILLRFAEHLENVRYQRVRLEKSELLRQSFRSVEPEAPVDPRRDPGKDVLFRKLVKDLTSEIGTLKGMVRLDPLTRLFNRGHFDERLAAEMLRARQEGTFLGLILIDIDDFKRLNDTFGHPAGDAMLAQAGLMLSQMSPPKGKAFAFRYGGEEMAMLLTETDPDVVMRMAEAVREQMTQIRLPEAPKLKVTASIGCYTARFVPTNGSFDLDERAFVAKADTQMYKAKRTGKNRVVAEVLP